MKPHAVPLAVLLVLAAVPSNGCAAAAPPLKFTGPGGETATIPFKLRSNHIYVRGTINESDSLWFFVDTGAGSNVVNSSTTKRLGLETEGMGQAHGAGGTVEASRVKNATFRITGLEFGDVLAASIPLDPVATQTGQPVGGIIGEPLFRNAVVEIDYDRSVLVVHKPGTWKANDQARRIPLTVHANNHPYIDATVTLPGRAPQKGSFVLDTGSAQALMFTPSFVEKNDALAALPKTLTGRSGGVGGMNLNPMGRVAKFDLGGLVLEQPVATFAQKLGGMISETDAYGNIGGEILSRFKVTFDYAGKSLYLAPGEIFTRPFEADMSGLILKVDNDSTKAIVVVGTQTDSPAAEAGLTDGDVLVSADGRPLDSSWLPDLRVRMRKPGETVHLAYRRGTEMKEATLVTRRLI